MLSKYISQYEYIRKMIRHGSADFKNVPVFSLDWIDATTTLDQHTRHLLKDLDNYYYVACHVCKYLPIYHLIMIYVELGEDAPNWKAAVEMTMDARIGKFNWMYSSITTEKMFMQQQDCPIIASESLFGSQINASITFFYTLSPKRIEYSISKLQYKETKCFSDFLVDDITLGIKIPNICVSMKKIYIFGSPRNNINFATLYFPPIPDMNVKYSTSPTSLCTMLESDEKVECLLIFTKSHEPDAEIDLLLSELSILQSTDIPIAGSFGVKKLIMTNISNDMESSTYIAFTQMKNSSNKFTAASIVIYQHQEFEEQLLKFKENIIRRTEEFCLSMVCYAKNKRDKEWVIIQQHFDCVVQCEVNGEIGNSCYLVDKETPNKRKRIKGTFTHAYSSVLLYIGWGEIRAG